MARADSADKEPFAWYVDSGASNHMSPNSSLFVEKHKLSTPTQITLGNCSVAYATHSGTVRLSISIQGVSHAITLQNVLYVPELGYSLLSVVALNDNGWTVTFCPEKRCTIAKDGLTIVASKKSTLFALYFSPPGSDASLNLGLIANSTYSAKLWHQRLGHLSYSAMTHLQSATSDFPGFRTLKASPCDDCITGKHPRSPFPSSSSISHSPLELVHSDVAGPMSTPTIGGGRFFVTFIDDFTRYATVYIIPAKSAVFEVFKLFKASAENFHSAKLKTLRTDGGGEYISKAFKSYLEQHGIAKQTTTPHTPQQNGVAERFNRTILERSRSMMNATSLPLAFWGEAVVTACYLINHSPSRPLSMKTPVEAWTGSKPALAHLRTFGCLAWSKIPDANRTSKLSPKSEQCIMLGYQPGVKGWKLLRLKDKKSIVSRDVIFDETRFPSFSVSELPLSTPYINPYSSFISPPVLPHTTHTHPSLVSSSPISHAIEVPSDDSLPEPTDAEPLSDSPSDHQPQLSESSDDPITAAAPLAHDATPEPEHSITRFIATSTPRSDCNFPLMPLERPDEHFSLMCSSDAEPSSYKAAMRDSAKDDWHAAMTSEHASLQKCKVWSLVPLPSGKKAIGCRWVYKLKRDAVGNIIKYKARLVAKGYTQVPGIDYFDTFAPVAKFQTIRTLLALAARDDLHLHQMDVKTAFLNGVLEEEVYMTQPEGMVKPGSENLVCKLHRSLYGLKQSPRTWNTELHTTLLGFGFTHSTADHGLYFLFRNSTRLFITVYVDDLLIASDSLELIAKFKRHMNSTYDMEDLGEVGSILGLHVKRDRAARTLSIGQPAYIRAALARFRMSDCKPVATPIEPCLTLTKRDPTAEDLEHMTSVPYQEAVGTLIYLSIASRPDISFAVSTVSQFSARPLPEHWRLVKRIFAYLSGTTDLYLTYSAQSPSSAFPTPPLGFSDSDWGSSKLDRRSYGGYCYLLANGAISWASKKQQTIALSSTEAELMALTQSAKEGIWMQRLFRELQITDSSPFTIRGDNQGALFLAKNPAFHNRTKHIDIQHHFIRECIASKQLDVEFCPTQDNTADIMTKGLARIKHELNLQRLGLQNLRNL